MLMKLCGVRLVTALGASLFAAAAFGQIASPPRDFLFISKSGDDCLPSAVSSSAPADPTSAGSKPRESSVAPYSGVGTTTVTRNLADGNRIVRTNTMRYARDSKGRVRTEYSLAALGPFALEETRTVVTIDDPVADRHYVLHPDEKRADVFDTKDMMPPLAGGGAVVVRNEAIDAGAPSLEASDEVVAGVAGVAAAGPATGFFVMSAPPGAPLPLPPGCGPRSMPGKKPQPAVSLGERKIEGVKAIGSRHEFEIAAGTIGNEQPITMRTEQWFSPELGVVIESTHSDPLAGDTTYKLTQIKRGEPNAALFGVPAGYTTHQMPGPKFERFDMRAPPPSKPDDE
jgi:hypothetical protein